MLTGIYILWLDCKKNRSKKWYRRYPGLATITDHILPMILFEEPAKQGRQYTSHRSKESKAVGSPLPKQSDRSDRQDLLNTTIGQRTGQNMPKDAQHAMTRPHNQHQNHRLSRSVVKITEWWGWEREAVGERCLIDFTGTKSEFKCCRKYKTIVRIALRLPNAINETSQKKRTCKSN